MLNLTKPAGVFAQLFGVILMLVGPFVFASGSAAMGLLLLGGGVLLFVEGRQPAKRQPIASGSTAGAPTVQKVENWVTAKGGQLTYRVIANRELSELECQQAVMEALKSGRLKEPAPGQTATLVLRD